MNRSELTWNGRVIARGRKADIIVLCLFLAVWASGLFLGIVVVGVPE